MSSTIPITLFFADFARGEGDRIAALFAGPVAIDSPLSGAIDGHDALEASLEQEGYWWQQHVREIQTVATLQNHRYDIVELLVELHHQGKTFDLPVAIFGQRSATGLGQIRIYHSTWPLNGHHTYRAPIVWPELTEEEEPEVVQAYFAALGRADLTLVLSLFAPDAYVREPSGAAYRHEGTEGLKRFYEKALQSGGIGLTHATTNFDGELFAVEYLCDSWGQTTFDPMAGCAFYELSDDRQHIQAVRIYDDVTPPSA